MNNYEKIKNLSLEEMAEFIRKLKVENRFKFRYFYNNTIYDVFAVDFMNETAQLVSLDRTETLFKGIDTEKLMQCTGLKDKNGTLIYEGDIVKRATDKAVIKWDDEIASFYMRWQGAETYIEDCEVIGNIYENPELLEVQND